MKIEPILNRMITGDKKWITYENIIRKRAYCEPEKPSPSTSTPNLTLNKRMLCIRWDIRGLIHYELLKPSEKLNSEKYCQQLDDLKTAVQEKRPEMFNRKDIILHHDNARPIKFIDSYKYLYFVSFQKRTELSGKPNIFVFTLRHTAIKFRQWTDAIYSCCIILIVERLVKRKDSFCKLS